MSHTHTHAQIQMKNEIQIYAFKHFNLLGSLIKPWNKMRHMCLLSTQFSDSWMSYQFFNGSLIHTFQTYTSPIGKIWL